MWEGHVAANCDDSKNDALKKTFSFGVHVVTKDKIVSVEQRQEIQPGLAVTEFEETEIVDWTLQKRTKEIGNKITLFWLKI